MTKIKIVGLDAGAETSGVVVLAQPENTMLSSISIIGGHNIPNSEVIEFIENEFRTCEKLLIIVEDVRPYNMRITDGIIQTIKFLGQIEWRLKDIGFDFKLISRWEVKQWVFMQFKSIAVPAIEKKIILAANRKEKECIAAVKPYVRRNSTPTFVYVDDRIVANAMRKHWNIKKPSRPGERAAYGLKDHSWQALGLCSYWMATMGLKINKMVAKSGK